MSYHVERTNYGAESKHEKGLINQFILPNNAKVML